MDNSTVTVHTAPSRSQAEVVAAALRGAGLAPEVRADDAGGAAPHIGLGTGGVRVVVAARDEEAALAVIGEATASGRRGGALVSVGRAALAVAAAGALVGLVWRALTL
jgi:hypothetical protein